MTLPAVDRQRAVELAIIVTAAAFGLMYSIKHNFSEPLWLRFGSVACCYLLFPLWAGVYAGAQRRGPWRTAAWGLVGALIVGFILFFTYTRHAPPAYAWGMKGEFAAGFGALLVLVAALAFLLGFDFRGYGMGLGRWKLWAPATLLVLVVMPLFTYGAFRLFPQFAAYYPMYRTADPAALWRFEGGMFIYMFSWEFLFRALLLFGLARVIGRWPAALLVAVPFAIMHYGKPEPELYSSYAGGVLLGWAILYVRAWWPAPLLHWAMAASMDLFAFYGRQSGGGG